MTEMLFSDMYHEPPSAAELTRRQREQVIDAVWKSPGITAREIAMGMDGITWLETWDRLREAEKAGDVHCRGVLADCGWFAGPGRDKG